MPDILIRMEMPGHCFNCSTKIDPDNRKCNIDGHVFEETLSKLTCRRDENCPLHELPQHGDLIDRRELLSTVMQVVTKFPTNNIAAIEHLDFVSALLRGATVVVPAERRDADA